MGNIFTTSDAERALNKANKDYYGRKTWEQAFGGIDLAEQQQIGSLQYDYSKAIGEAYASAYRNQQNIMSSNLGQGFKEQAMLSNEEALNEAFEKYRQNYLSGVSSVEKQATEARADIAEQRTTQAENVANVYNSMFGDDKNKGYLQSLYNKFETAGKKEFYENPSFTRFMKDELDEKGEATGKRVLKDPSELRKMLYDEQGNLTADATNIYDLLFNLDTTYGDEYGYGQWLSETNPKLYDWLKSTDTYNFTAAGTNLGTIKELIGMKSTDSVYDYIDKVAGLSTEELEGIKANSDELINDWNKTLEKIDKYYGDGKLGDKSAIEEGYSLLTKDIEKAIDNLKEYSETIGLDILAEKDEDWNALFNSLNNALNKAKSNDSTTALEDIYNTYIEKGKELRDKPFLQRLGQSIWEFVKTPIEVYINRGKTNKQYLKDYRKSVEDLRDAYNAILIQLINMRNQQNIK